MDGLKSKKKKKKRKMLLWVTIASITMPRSRVKEYRRRNSQETQTLGVERFAQLDLGGHHITCAQIWEIYFCSFCGCSDCLRSEHAYAQIMYHIICFCFLLKFITNGTVHLCNSSFALFILWKRSNLNLQFN